jgi:hypothetical protein
VLTKIAQSVLPLTSENMNNIPNSAIFLLVLCCLWIVHEVIRIVWQQKNSRTLSVSKGHFEATVSFAPGWYSRRNLKIRVVITNSLGHTFKSLNYNKRIGVDSNNPKGLRLEDIELPKAAIKEINLAMLPDFH